MVCPITLREPRCSPDLPETNSTLPALLSPTMETALEVALETDTPETDSSSSDSAGAVVQVIGSVSTRGYHPQARQKPWTLLKVSDILKALDKELEQLESVTEPQKQIDAIERFTKTVVAAFYVLSNDKKDPSELAPPLDGMDLCRLWFSLLGNRSSYLLDVEAPKGWARDLSLGLFRSLYPTVRNAVVASVATPTDRIKIVKAVLMLKNLNEIFYNHATLKRQASDLKFVASVIKFAALTCNLWGPIDFPYEAFRIVGKYLVRSLGAENVHVSTESSPFWKDIYRDFLVLLHYQSSEFFRSRCADEQDVKDTSDTLKFAGFLILAELRYDSEGKDKAKGIRKIIRGVGYSDDKDSCDYCLKQESEEVKLRRCSQCVVARYCSAECQLADWKSGVHKKRCRHAET